MLDLYVHDECVKYVYLEVDVLNVRSYLCSWRNVSAMMILSARIVCDDNAVDVPDGHPGKDVLCHFGGEGKLQLRGC